MRAIELIAEPGQPIGELTQGGFGIGYIFTGAITSEIDPPKSYKSGHGVSVRRLKSSLQEQWRG